jgi:hypothetical protein
MKLGGMHEKAQGPVQADRIAKSDSCPWCLLSLDFYKKSSQDFNWAHGHENGDYVSQPLW